MANKIILLCTFALIGYVAGENAGKFLQENIRIFGENCVPKMHFFSKIIVF